MFLVRDLPKIVMYVLIPVIELKKIIVIVLQDNLMMVLLNAKLAIINVLNVREQLKIVLIVLIQQETQAHQTVTVMMGTSM